MPPIEPHTSLIIFAREPKDHRVKTRLLKDLPAAQVTQLYKAFIKDVLQIAAQVACQEHQIYYATDTPAIPFLSQFKSNFDLHGQAPGDLGARLHAALTATCRKGSHRVVLIGTDCLNLKAQDIEGAFDNLKTHDIVVGPSTDGGYYLIGLKAPCRALFEGIDWSTDQVLKQTLQRAAARGLSVMPLEPREDIDTLENLKNLFHQSTEGRWAHTQPILTAIAKDQQWT